MLPEAPRAAAAAEPGAARAPARSSASAAALLPLERCVAAIDMDCFYAQCEELRRPELRGKPVGVQQKMLVITSNYAARAFGIQKGDSLRVVREKCPGIVICNGEDLSFYEEVSKRVFDVASRWSKKVEKLGLDEVFVDLTELVAERLASLQRDPGSVPRLVQTGQLYPAKGTDEGDPEDPGVSHLAMTDWRAMGDEDRCRVRLSVASELCAELRASIRQDVGLTSSAGVSVSKLLAKLVASWRKPDQQTVLLPTAERLASLLPDHLPVQKIPGIGFSSTQKCHDMGIVTIEDFIVASDPAGAGSRRGLLLGRFDEKAVAGMRALCLGVDASEVKPTGPPKSCSAEDSFWASPLRSDAEVAKHLEALARKLLVKVRADERHHGCRSIPTLAVSLRHAPRSDSSDDTARRERRQMHLDGGLRIASGSAAGSTGTTTMGAGPSAACSEAAPSALLSEADGLKARQVAERAFGLFRKMVPSEPFALHILSLQVQFDEAVPLSQRLLQFAPRDEAASGVAAAANGLPQAAGAGSPVARDRRASASVAAPEGSCGSPGAAIASGRGPGKRPQAAEFFSQSRLSFIGSWRARFRKFMKELLEVEAGARSRGVSADFSTELRELAAQGEACTDGRLACTNFLHIDMDCFFVSVALGGPSAAPAAVTSGRGDTSEVCSANYAARGHGICANMFLKEARARCPELDVIPTTPELFDQFAQTSREVYRILLSVTERIEPLSCDEMFLQLTGAEGPRYPPVGLAAALRAEILRTTGCPASIGIGPSTVLARWATRRAKPPGDGVYHTPLERALAELDACPTRSLSGVGGSTATRLEAMGARTCGEARRLPPQDLQSAFGATLGLHIAAMVRGEDPKEMQFDVRRSLSERPNSMSSEVNWGVRLSERHEAEAMVEDICRQLARRLQEEEPQLLAGTVRLTLRVRQPGAPEPTKAGGHGLCDLWSRSERLPGAGSHDAAALAQAGRRLLAACGAPVAELRGVGVSVGRLADASQGGGTILRWLKKEPAEGAEGDVAAAAGGAVSAAPLDSVCVSDGSDEDMPPASAGRRAATEACGEVAPDAAKALAAMGFAAVDAAEALRAVGGADLQVAVEWLLERARDAGPRAAAAAAAVAPPQAREARRVSGAGQRRSSVPSASQADLWRFAARVSGQPLEPADPICID
ncbi:unnamed protein product [Prorocentrum cordatum]|nr:unnamed protein product [Polarella glacialis]